MSRVLAALLALNLFFLLPVAALAQGEALARAMSALRDGDWAGANIAARGDGRVASDVILWHALRDGRGDAAQLQDFLARNGDWPGLPFLRKKSEITISGASDRAILTFFENDLPQTGAGALALARAHLRAGEDGAAAADAVLAWRTLAMSADERTAFRKSWGRVLAPHHIARLDMALWEGWERNARAQIPLVSEGWQKLAEARLSLRSSEAGVDAKIAAIPAALADHPGLAYERFKWRMRKGRRPDAIKLLLERSDSAETLGEPWAWARDRRNLARDRMRDGAVREAYQIAANHHLVEGSDFADLEWLSGYLALRFLDRPDLALVHFERFRDAIWTPISVGRGGYWLGRAHEALNQPDQALAAYREGAQFQTAFYGLLAAERANLPINPALSGREDFGDWRQADFTKRSDFQAGLLLLQAGEDVLAERFFTHVAESLDRTGMGQLGQMLMELKRPHIQVMLGKRAAKFGFEIPGPYYALHPDLVKRKFPVPTELVLSIARRESEFDPRVVSGAGARGLMQLMPGTAREVSGDLGLEYRFDGLLSDPGYNATLGSAYLAELADQFGGNAVMMAAGYNAGPSRPIRWMDRFGDPRKGEVDMIDWIEFIPFDETRNYVMRVTESLPVYRARLGRDPLPVPFSQELTGKTLRRVR
jgi:soluble lytic murein transglycosylase